jgi:hypothetical protein
MMWYIVSKKIKLHKKSSQFIKLTAKNVEKMLYLSSIQLNYVVLVAGYERRRMPSHKSHEAKR